MIVLDSTNFSLSRDFRYQYEAMAARLFRPDFVGDETHSIALNCNGCSIGPRIHNVMQPWPMLGDVPRAFGRIVGVASKQLQPALAYWPHD